MEYSAKENLIYFVSGMWCSTCAKSVESSVSKISEVKEVSINYATKLLKIIPEDENSLDVLDDKITKEIKKLGFYSRRQEGAWINGIHEEIESEINSHYSWVHLSIVWFLAMWSSMFAFTNYLGTGVGDQFLIAQMSFYTGAPAILLGVYPYAKAGLRALFLSKLITIDFVIFLGAVSVLFLSIKNMVNGLPETFADSGSMIIAILLTAKKVENLVFNSLSTSILFQLNSNTTSVDVFRKNEWKTADPVKIKKGDLVRIPKEETIPFDGIIESDKSQVNNHLLSGEDSSIDVYKGERVLAGAIALSELELKVDCPIGGRLIDNWAQSALLENNSGNSFFKLTKTIEKYISLFSLLSASALGFIKFLISGSIPLGIESFFIGVLVFCPCLFASIIPMSKQFAYLTLRRAGIGISKIESLLDCNNLEKFCFDKTGTLEAVESELILEEEISPFYENIIRKIIETSEHPILMGISKMGHSDSEDLVRITEIQNQGVIGYLANGDRITIGKSGLVDDSNPIEVYPGVYINQKKVGHILLKKVYNEKSIRFMATLLKLFPKSKIKILSGDPNPEVNKGFYFDSRITYFGNLTPEGKVQHIEPNTMFIGDGLNDTLAFAKSKVSIRIGRRVTSLSPVDFQITSFRLEKVLTILRYSKKFKKVILQTVVCAFIYNFVAFSLVLFDLFTPLGAVFAMLLSFSLLLASTLRLLSIGSVTETQDENH